MKQLFIVVLACIAVSASAQQYYQRNDTVFELTPRLTGVEYSLTTNQVNQVRGKGGYIELKKTMVVNSPFPWGLLFNSKADWKALLVRNGTSIEVSLINEKTELIGKSRFDYSKLCSLVVLLVTTILIGLCCVGLLTAEKIPSILQKNVIRIFGSSMAIIVGSFIGSGYRYKGSFNANFLLSIAACLLFYFAILLCIEIIFKGKWKKRHQLKTVQ